LKRAETPRAVPPAPPPPRLALAPRGCESRETGCAELRCGCGNLLARRVAAGVELKCRRCKRMLVLPLADG
jgi:hypothetical protein